MLVKLTFTLADLRGPATFTSYCQNSYEPSKDFWIFSQFSGWEKVLFYAVHHLETLLFLDANFYDYHYFFLIAKSNSIRGFVHPSLCQYVREFTNSKEYKEIQVNSTKIQQISQLAQLPPTEKQRQG